MGEFGVFGPGERVKRYFDICLDIIYEGICIIVFVVAFRCVRCEDGEKG